MAKKAYIGVPNGYKVLEYIESTGTQYIDTGVYLNQDSKVEISLYNPTDFNASTNASILFGSRDSSSGTTNTFTIIANVNGKNYMRWDYGTSLINASNVLPVGNHVVVKDKNYNYLDNNLILTNEENDFAGSYTAHLFGTNTGGTNTLPFVGKVYYCKIWNDDVLVRDFVPCEYSGEYGLYDKVSGVFYTNAGTGDFVAGAETGVAYGERYHVLEYIESSGTQYIVSDMQFYGDNYKIECKYDKADIDSTTAFCTQGTTDDNNYRIMCIDHDAKTDRRLFYCGEQEDATNRAIKNVFPATLNEVTIEANDGVLKYTINDNAQVTVSPVATNFDVKTDPMWIFGNNRASASVGHQLATMKFYYFKVSQNGVLVCDYIPCKRNSDGVVGVYNRVNNAFYTNAGSGTFVAGAETGEVISVGVAREAKKIYIGVEAVLGESYKALDYIESTGTQYIDTGLLLTQDSKLEMLVSHFDTNGNRRTFGSRSSATSNNFSVVSGPVGGTMSIVTDFDNYSNNRLAYVINGDELLEISISKERLKINDSEKVVSTYGDFTTPSNAYLFNASGSYPSGYANAKMRLYYCRIYDGDMLVRNFVPCRRNSDGVLGVYDRVNDVFYANAGSDTFTAGSETGEIIGVIHSTARKITRIYKGVDDVAQLLWSEGAALKSFAIAYLADDVTWNLSVEEGMTWGDWIDSEYNTIAACPVNTGIRIPYEDVKDGYIYVNHVVLDEYVAVAEIAAEIAEGVTYPCSKLRPAPPPML